jgi:hypothetical protein
MATIQTINIGTSANDNTGDTLRNAFDKTNQNNTALNNDLATKAPLASPTFTGTVILPLNTSIGNVSSTEIGYVDGVTSAIQTQLNDKAPLASPTITGTMTVVNDASFNGVRIGKGGGNIATNSVLGFGALILNTSGVNNSAVGYGALNSAVGLNANTALGLNSLLLNQYGDNNTAVGASSLSACVAYDNTAIGYGSGSGITNQYNTTSIGNQATSIEFN